MAPRMPPSFPSCRGEHAATPITIVSSSAASDPSVVFVLVSSDSDEATSRPRAAAARRRSSPPSPSVVSVPSPVVIVVDSGDEATRSAARRRRPPPTSPPSSSAVVSVPSATDKGGGGGSGDEAITGRAKKRKQAARRRRPPSPSSSAVTARSPAPSATTGGSDEATSRAKKKKKTERWSSVDETKILQTLAELREENYGVIPQASVLLKELYDKHVLIDRRRAVTVTELSDKLYRLKDRFAERCAKLAAAGRKRPRRNSRKRSLYETCKRVWPEVFQDSGAAYREAKAARRRERARRPGDDGGISS